MVILRDKIGLFLTDDLQPYSKNNKKHPKEQINLLIENINRFGFTNPLLIDKNNVIIAGHARFEAASILGIKELPCILIDDLTESEIKVLRISDNRIGELAEVDWTNLEEEFFELKEEGLDFLTGYNEEDFPIKENDVSEDDYEVSEEIETDIVEGDIIQLGNHRLMCGDSIKNYKDFIFKINIDLLFTDPPYGVSVVGSNGSIGKGVKAKEGVYNPVIGDDTYFDPTYLLEIGNKQVIWGANYFHDNLPLNTRWIIWDKDRPSGTTFSDCEIAWTNQKGIAVNKYKCTWNGMIREGENDKRVHPTQKPLKICSEVIQDFSKPNDSVVDLFGGSGSTLIACEQLNRKCYMMELDPKYCEVICQRWEKLTGKKRIKLNGN